MTDTIDQCRAVCCACVVICDPHVDGENGPLGLLASLVVLCALKGRRTPSIITIAVNNQLVVVLPTEEFFISGVLSVSLLDDGRCLEKGVPGGVGTL